MQFATIAAAFFAALVATEAATIPREHHARFLVEKDAVAAELAAWKNSPAGRYAKKHGFYKDPIHIESVNATQNNEHLVRFFLTKLNIEKLHAANPEATFGYTPFSLMTDDEFKKYVSKSGSLGKGGFFRGLQGAEVVEEVEAPRQLATSVDWTTSGCVAGVKDQGQCGDCWAFSAIGSLESANCLATGSLTLFSEQQVNDCDPQSSGCDGGWPAWGLSYIQSNGGVCTENSYPYTSGDSGQTGTCSDSSCDTQPITISRVAGVSASDSALVAAINKQPVAVAVAAGNNEWKQYTGGVISSCSTSQIDHAVLAVGYDGTSFKLKNQWGTSWGAGGYLRLKRISSTKAACSVINSHNTYPILG